MVDLDFMKKNDTAEDTVAEPDNNIRGGARRRAAHQASAIVAARPRPLLQWMSTRSPVEMTRSIRIRHRYHYTVTVVWRHEHALARIVAHALVDERDAALE